MMLPKKKQKLSIRSTLIHDKSSTGTPIQGGGGEKPDIDYDFINDPWTDEQETSLLKGVIRWKPVGLSSWKSSFHPGSSNH
jgi:MRG-binding protein